MLDTLAQMAIIMQNKMALTCLINIAVHVGIALKKLIMIQ